MNWMSDVYVYEDVSGGWTTHVAGRRRAIPPIPDIMMGSFAMKVHEWSGCKYDRQERTFSYASKWRKFVAELWGRFSVFWHNKIHMGSLSMIPLRPIGLAFDGETFNDPTAAECADRLVWLAAQGYRVPRHAIDALRMESMLEGQDS